MQVQWTSPIGWFLVEGPRSSKKNRSGEWGVVTAISTTKSELEFSTLSVRRYVIWHKINLGFGGVGWGLERTPGAQTVARRRSKSISEFASRRILEILPGLGEGFPTPFNNAPDKLFNTHIFIIIIIAPVTEGFRSFFKSQTLHQRTFPLFERCGFNIFPYSPVCVSFYMYSDL